MKRIEDYLGSAKRVIITGHIHPDGDCVGSCLGLRNYIRAVCPEVQTDVYLEPFSSDFLFLEGAREIRQEYPEVEPYDLAFALDSGDEERLGAAGKYFASASRRVCIDHHITNQGYGEEWVICPQASSTSEVLYTLMDEGKIDTVTAECLYLGIVHDTGVFRHTNTGEETMRIAGRLITKGVNPAYLIDETFYKKTFAQNKALARALNSARLWLDGAVIGGVITLEDFRELAVTSKDLDGIVDQLRVTAGVEVAVFLYELKAGEFKVSMRANGDVDVSRIAAGFGGGGHVKAAGCTLCGGWTEIMERLVLLIEAQLDGGKKENREQEK